MELGPQHHARTVGLDERPEDPFLSWDWDTVSPAYAWKHSHNYVHHTHTNIVGLDKDVGYEIMRVDPKQNWHPVYLLQPFYNVLLMLFFEWGVALHDLDFEAIRKGKKDKKQLLDELSRSGRRSRAGDQGLRRLSRALRAQGVQEDAYRERDGKPRPQPLVERGHLLRPFPRPGPTPRKRPPTRAEERGTSANSSAPRNIDGSDTFHLMSGNLSYQVEHHLYPDLPSSRYKEIAPRVKENLREVRAALQHGAVPSAVADGPADDHQAGAPGRREPPEGAAVQGAPGAGRRPRAPRPRGARPHPGVPLGDGTHLPRTLIAV